MTSERLHLWRRTDAPQPAPRDDVRTLGLADAPELAKLMISAYRGTHDYEGETEAQALEEIERTLAGTYGDFDPQASLGRWEDGTLISAVVVTHFEGAPLFAFCMTAAGRKRIGHCKQLMLRSLAVLAEHGHSAAHLYVSSANAPALTLYRQLHFTEVTNALSEND